MVATPTDESNHGTAGPVLPSVLVSRGMDRLKRGWAGGVWGAAPRVSWVLWPPVLSLVPRPCRAGRILVSTVGANPKRTPTFAASLAQESARGIFSIIAGARLRGMNDPRTRILPLLRQGEQLLWVGQPDPRVRFTGADAFLVPFSILWGGFAVFWEIMAVSSVKQPFFVLWGIPFVVVGLYFIFGRFILKARRKLATVYALTARRAIVCTGDRSVADSPVSGMPTRVDRSRDGRHVSVTFGSQGLSGLFGMYQNTGLDFFSLGLGQTVAFYDVEDGDGLLAALDQAQAGHSPAGPAN
jgi:hypothetical protein